MYLIFTFNLIIISTIVNCIEITLPNGKINGCETETINGFKFYAYQQIPYAAPPVGKLRFKAPQPARNWDGVLDTTKNDKICFQFTHDLESENEDCLYLNVYTPVNPDSDEILPVLFFIHGGMFQSDSSSYDSYGPDFLIEENVVIVTINYRLGPLGFLSTGDSILPGNNGLKDQNMALQWVNNNIFLFGGDKSKITVMGQSAGSASVAYQIISKKSSGLFRAAVCQSGSAISSWAYQRHARKIAYQIGAALDSNFTEDKSSEELLELLQNVPVENIDKAQIPGLAGNRIGKGDLFSPVIEPPSDEAFITDLMHESLVNGNFNKVPLLIGINSEERITLSDNLDSLIKTMAEYDDDIRLIVNADFNVTGDHHNAIVGNAIRKLYTDGLFQDDLPSSIRFHSDVRYTTSVIRHAHLQSFYSDVYFYQFSYDGKLGNVDSYLEGAGSVAHSENNRYLWRIVESNYDNTDLNKFPENDALTSKRFVKIITNFVKYLNPTPQPTNLLQNITWPLAQDEHFQYVDINENLEIKVNPKLYKHWKTLYDTYGHPPYDTY